MMLLHLVQRLGKSKIKCCSLYFYIIKCKASVVLDDCFAIKDIRIIQGDDKLFIAMPSRKLANGEYSDVAHPINSETRKMFEDAIIEEYNNTEDVAEEEE